MASEIRVDKINSLSGVGTVTLSPTGVDIAGITTAETLKATTGIVTTLTATTGIVTTFEATTGNITTLRAPTGIVTSLEATTGDITTLRAPTGIVTSFVTNTAKVGAAVTITSDGIDASGIGITCANINGGQIGRRNMAINGAMRINQRGTSSHTLNSGNANAYIVDRFLVQGGEGTYVVSQDTDVPTGQGFDNSIKIDCTGADTSLSTNFESYIQYLPESRDLSHLAYGTSGAKTVTFSFWVKSNLAVSFGFYMYVPDAARAYQTTFAISSANTWEKKVITIVGDTTGNGFNNDNGIGAEVRIYLATGSGKIGSSNQNAWGTDVSNRIPSGTNLLSSTDNNFYFTGFQMEVGDQATPFEHRLHCEELLLCQRYYFDVVQASGTNETFGFTGSVWQENNGSIIHIRYPVKMRATPTFGSTNGTQYWRYFSGNDLSTAYLDGNGLVVNLTRTYGGELYAYLSSGTGSVGRTSWVRANNASSKAYYDAEL